MTVSAETPIALSVANGVTTVFPYSFTVLDEPDLVVKGALAGVVTTYIYGVDYLLSGVGTPSGSVDFTVAPANGTVITRYRASVIERETDYQDNGDLPADTLNLDLDRLWLVLQELIYGTRGSPSALRVPEGETIPALPARADRINTVPAFDSNGDPTVAVPVSGSAADVLIRLADTSSASNNAGLVALSISLAYANSTVGKAFRDRVWCITDHPFSASAAASDNYAAILAAQTALAAAGGGTLVVPRGSFRYLTAIPRVANVDFVGLGWDSILNPDGCSAFTYGFTTGFGQSATRNLRISGSNGATQIGIYQAGTLNDADELYGVVIEDCAITGFNVAIQFRTVRNLLIRHNWIQDNQSGIKLIGKNIVAVIRDNNIVSGSSVGAGTRYGIYLNSFNYTSGSGVVGPEGIRIDAGQVQGFEYGVEVVFGIEVRIVNPDISATIVGIRWSTAISLSISDGYIQVNGASATFGIHAPAQSAVNNTKYTIRGTKVIGASVGANVSGIMLGTRAALGNVDGVTIENCEFTGFTGYDIETYDCGLTRIVGNRCLSSGTTQSMSITSMPAGRPTFIDQNQCAKLITYDQASFDSGLTLLGTNIISGTTTNFGRAAPTTPTYAAGNFTANGAMTWTVDAGDVVTYDYSFHGKYMTVRFSIVTSSVGGVANTTLQIAIPAGRTATKATTNPILVVDNGTRSIGYCTVTAGGSTINCLLSNAGNWAAAANTTQVQGEITFEV